MQDTILIGFGNQKGGVGKSTLSEIVASILCYDYGYRLCVIDCDEGQHSFYKLREREGQRLQHSPYMARQILDRFRDSHTQAYEVYSSNIEEGIAVGRKLSTSGSYDIIIYDMPGGGDLAKLLSFSLQLDYLLIPIETDVQSLEASLLYATIVKEAGITYEKASIKEIFLLWNKIDRTVRQDVLTQYNKRFSGDLNLQMLDSMIYKSRRFSIGIEDARSVSEIFRSTLVSPRDIQLKPTGISNLINEIIKKILKQ